MLLYKLLDDYEGLMLIGSSSTFQLIRQIALDVDSRTPLLDNKEDGTPLSVLAYEARKTYEHKREVIPPPEGCLNCDTSYGVKIVWPILLAQTRLLRMSLAYIDHGKRHQAITYALEAAVEDGLKEAFQDEAHNIIYRLDSLTTGQELDALLDTASLFLSWNKQQRKQKLVELFIPGWMTDSNHF